MRETKEASILIVDDQENQRLVLEAALVDLGCNLVTARSGHEALEHLLSTDFAVILMDVQMPTLNGFETARRIRQRERSRETPIIFLSGGCRSEADILEGYAAGAVDYILKPFDLEALRSNVQVFVDLWKKPRHGG